MSTNSECDLSVIIVGVNARDFVRQCLRSLDDATWNGVTWEAVYVDNGSTDGTLEMIGAEFPATKTIANDSNLGYCPAANAGARIASGRYYAFINDDTIVKGEALSMLVPYMDEHPDIGTTGSRLVFPDGRDQWSGRRFPRLLDSIFSRRGVLARIFPRLKVVRDYMCKDLVARGEPFDVDWVSAAGHIVRPDAFWEVGGYAEDYYYWHEMVICHRLKCAGHRVVLHPGSVIIHYEGFGSGPRPFSRQRFHIIDFHRGAYRADREVHGYRVLGFRSAFTAACLTARATLLLIGAMFTSLRRPRTPGHPVNIEGSTA